MFHPKHVEPFTGDKILHKKVSSCWNILKKYYEKLCTKLALSQEYTGMQGQQNIKNKF
jgi:hypothetical protein